MYLHSLTYLTTLFLPSISHALSLPPIFTPSTPPPPSLPTRFFTLTARALYSSDVKHTSTGGIRVQASNGSFWVNQPTSKPATACASMQSETCAEGVDTVLFVDAWGVTWLNAVTPQQVYVDTKTGVLSYVFKIGYGTTPLPPSANLVNFVHLGSTAPGGISYSANYAGFGSGPGFFEWNGNMQNGWYFCPNGAQGSQLVKWVPGSRDWRLCKPDSPVFAVDWMGSGPAAGQYI